MENQSSSDYFKLWVDDVLADTISGLDNDTHAVGASSIGVLSGGWGSISGTIYFDAYESRSETYIGLDPNITLSRNDQPERRMADSGRGSQVVSADTQNGAPEDHLSIYSRLTGRAVYSPAMSVLQTTVSETLNWHYEYDGLYRLELACSNGWDDELKTCQGDKYSYTYDSFGNRLSETVNGITTSYTYDAANRLTEVGGVTYTYDDNGNLLSDGVHTYTYDYANRLATLTDGTNTYSYAYNGLGDRVQQTVNGVTTTYVLDLNTTYTQVLADGTDTYLYGLGRIGEQEGAGWDYHLSDALGSVRQLIDGSGAVSLAQTYAPYGEVVAKYGTGESSYAFAGEMTDASGMQYLRARYYAPTTGRFISRDVWQGDPMQPMGYNLWLYAYSNPIMYVDPSGEIANWLIGGGVGALVNTGLYLFNESIHGDGFDVHDKGDWIDLGVAAGTGFVGGALMATPGGALLHSAGVGIMTNLVEDQVNNIMWGNDFSATNHLVAGALGALEGVTENVLPDVIKHVVPSVNTHLVTAINSGIWEGVGTYAGNYLAGEQTSLKEVAWSFAGGVALQTFFNIQSVDLPASSPHGPKPALNDIELGYFGITWEGGILPTCNRLMQVLNSYGSNNVGGGATTNINPLKPHGNIYYSQ